MSEHQLQIPTRLIIILGMDQVAWIIYNPLAGPYHVEAEVEVARRFWAARGWTVKMCATQAPGHAVVLARQAVEEGCQMVLAAGGDGTIGQIAQGMAGSRTLFAVLPTGTANAFAKLLNLVPSTLMGALDLERVCQQLAAGKVQAIDLGRAHISDSPAEGHCFISWAGAGLDGCVIGRVEPRPKWFKQMAGRRLGWLAYLIRGVPAVIRFPGVPARVTVDDQTVTGTFVQILIANSRLYGGGLMELSLDACLDDGYLDVWLFKGKMVLETIGHAVRLLTSRHEANKNTIHLRGRQVLVEAEEPAAVELDGELAGRSPFTASIEPRFLRLLAPQCAPANLFCQPGISFHTIEK